MLAPLTLFLRENGPGSTPGAKTDMRGPEGGEVIATTSYVYEVQLDEIEDA